MQLPAYSPAEPSALIGALADVFRGGSESARVRLKEYVSTRFRASEVVLTGSGTQALQLALEQAASSGQPRSAKRLVALPAYSCYDVVTAAVGANMWAVFYDIDPVTLVPEPDSLKEALREGAEIVVAGNLYGFPLDWNWLQAECRAAGAVLIEDAAQGLGSGWQGQSFGSFGDYSVLSFGRGKGWTAGSGGALLARGERISEAFAISSEARAGFSSWFALWMLWLIGRPALYRIPTLVPRLGLGETRYREPTEVEGMPPLVAAIACRLAGEADRAIATRRQWAMRWTTLLDECAHAGRAWTRCMPLRDGTCGYLRYPLCLRSTGDRERMLRGSRQHGAAPGYPLPLAALPQAQRIVVRHDVEADGAQILARALMTLPTHPRMSGVDFRSVATDLGELNQGRTD